MKVVVISLGGSVIIPDTINYTFLDSLKKVLRKNYRRFKFVIVCGGGSIARTYMRALAHEGKNEKEIALAGIRATRMNALFLMQFFGKEVNDTLPHDMHDVKRNLRKNKMVICGALRYADDETSDGTAAKLAHFLKARFINITNVPGLYNADPKKNPHAKFIAHISWKEFEHIATAMTFKPGQHFVLDQQAAVTIRQNKIHTYVIGPDTDNFNNLLHGRTFRGTQIYDIRP